MADRSLIAKDRQNQSASLIMSSLVINQKMKIMAGRHLYLQTQSFEVTVRILMTGRSCYFVDLAKGQCF